MERNKENEEDINTNMESTKEAPVRLEGESDISYLYRKYKLKSFEERHKEDMAIFRRKR